MKSTITQHELAVLDLHACTADKLQELADYIHRARPHIAGLIHGVLDVGAWDHQARQTIERFVASQPRTIESLLEELGVGVER